METIERRKTVEGVERRGERGALLAGMATLVTILSIFSLVGFQEYAEVLRRDKEAEMLFRAQEIARAIQRYRKDRGGTAPLEFEQLIEPGTKGQYYIRRLYEDPLVKDGKWGFLHVGPGNQLIDPHAENADPTAAGGLAGRQGQGLGAFNKPQRAGQGGAGGLKPGQGQTVGGPKGTPRTGLGGVGNPRPGGEATGLPIAGVRTLSEDKPFRVYNGLTEYSEWLITYLDLEIPKVPGQGNRRGAPGQRQQQRQQRQQKPFGGKKP